MKLTEIEKQQKLMRLMQMRLKLQASASFSHFLGYSNPKYELEWFHRVIAEHCQMLLDGKIKNLMVFVPPQHGKSEIISRNFPAWALGRDPDLKIASCSYAASFSHFLGYSNPKYELEWFHRVIAEHCQMLLDGKIKNLMVFVPPQHGKSEIISRNFPAWALGRDPDLKIASCSYAADLSEQFSRSVQRIIESPEYQEIFPDTYLSTSQQAKNDPRTYIKNVDFFETVGHRGFYKAVGVGGPLTGTPVDIAIIDDPVKDAAEAYSLTYRQKVWEWYNTVLTTRLHNHSRQLFIMTRWHEDDLAGRILKAEADEWKVLAIPAICEKENDGGLSNRKVGEALWASHHSVQKLAKQKSRSPREFSALYQQHPVIEGGNIVKRDWFQHISLAEFKSLRFNEPMHFYLDTAYGKKKPTGNDPSGILAACRIGRYVYIYNAQKVWKEMPDLLRFLPEYMAAHEGNAESKLHVEPKANGESVVHMLKAISSLNVKETPTPVDSKETRFRVVSPRVECGRVFLVDGSWNDDFLDEVCGFPAMEHDEFVDILGYAINDLYEEDDDTDYENIDKSMFGL
nr:terminase large subunit [Caudoviricetes sp.]